MAPGRRPVRSRTVEDTFRRTVAPGRRPVRSRTVEDTVRRAVGQAYASMGGPDPCLNMHGALDFRITSLYRAWNKTEDPPSRVKPLPLTLLSKTVDLAHQEQSPAARVAAECLVLAFYFLFGPVNTSASLMKPSTISSASGTSNSGSVRAHSISLRARSLTSKPQRSPL